MCLALREGLFGHGPGDGVGAVLVGDGFAHTFHGDVGRHSGQFPNAHDNKCELTDKG
jgi:hypothetical protein